MAERAIVMPAIGESVTGGTVTEWLKKVGDVVEKDELIVTIATDKVETELPCEFSGTLAEILVNDGEEVEVGQPLAIIEAEGFDALPDSLSINIKESEPTPAAKNEQSVQSLLPKNEGPQFLSPVVRKIAAEHDLNLADLAKIAGKGINGRLRKKDLLEYLNPARAEKNSTIQLIEQPGDQRRPLSPIRLTIAKNLEESYRNIPHVTTFAEADVTAVLEWRRKHKNQFNEDHDLPLTLVGIFMYLATQVLKGFPKFNSHFDGKSLLQKKAINLGFALRLSEDELVVPNIKNSEQLSFLEFMKNLNHLIKKGKAKSLTAADFQNTTFTISNTGSFGSLAGTPIIIQPQVAVLALGEIRRAPAVVQLNDQETLEIRDLMMLSLSYDHRVIDGAAASLFLTKLKEGFIKLSKLKV